MFGVISRFVSQLPRYFVDFGSFGSDFSEAWKRVGFCKEIRGSLFDKDVALVYLTAQKQLLKLSDSGKGHIRLATGPKAETKTHGDVGLKSLSLDFVNRHRPSEF